MNARLAAHQGNNVTAELIPGQLDDVRIWSRALAAAEVAALRAGQP